MNTKKVDRWLNGKVNDPTIESLYENTKYLLDIAHCDYEPINKFYMYYGKEDDTDVRHNDDVYTYMLDEYNNGGYVPVDSEELRLLELLDKIVERYRPLSFFENIKEEENSEDNNKNKGEEDDNTGWETVTHHKSKDVESNRPQEESSEEDEYANDTREIDIIIPPNSNRYHANYLFKKMVDYSIENNMCYGIEDPNFGTYGSHMLIYPELKRAFYSFCCNNSKHT